MNQSPYFSIIVPVYSVEAYLKGAAEGGARCQVKENSLNYTKEWRAEEYHEIDNTNPVL